MTTAAIRTVAGMMYTFDQLCPDRRSKSVLGALAGISRGGCQSRQQTKYLMIVQSISCSIFQDAIKQTNGSHAERGNQGLRSGEPGVPERTRGSGAANQGQDATGSVERTVPTRSVGTRGYYVNCGTWEPRCGFHFFGSSMGGAIGSAFTGP